MSSIFRKLKVLEFADGVKVTVRELEVSTFLLVERGELELSDAVVIKVCTGLEHDDLSVEVRYEILSIVNGFNADMIDEKESDDGSSKKISGLIARLMCLGHPKCVHYGISFFRDAMMEAEMLENERTVSVAYAVRVRNAKDADFSGFIDALSVKRKEIKKDIAEDVANLKNLL